MVALTGGVGPLAPAILSVAAAAGAQPIVYDPGANVDVVTGLQYATAVRQTVTLQFANPLPGGDYTITVSPKVCEVCSTMLAKPRPRSLPRFLASARRLSNSL